ncbi:MAG: response regulator [Anaerolineales bacterium]|uniref:response regulator n=1 Tax=Candidatus Villigracilis vicinus TaxID=3140679 RepID=UPI003136698A|nr:response regulator [Anaerolineales bacterium]MBK7448644.1 response regulator [Anaerolineales bacterium]
MAKILVIDDDFETIKLLEAIIQMEGHEVHSVHESRNALKVVEDLMPTLVLLDIMMPEINGIAICKLIKSNPHLKHIKVMMVSALSDEGTKRDSLHAGADQFVTKPILPRILIHQINDLLAE